MLSPTTPSSWFDEFSQQEIIDALPYGLVVQAAGGETLAANQAALDILGVSLDQIQGRTSFDPRWRAIHEDGRDFPGDEHPTMVALRTGHSVRDVIMGVYHPKADQYRWINIIATPLVQAHSPNRLIVIATFEDITQRKLAEDALRASEQNLRHFVEYAPAAIAMFDRDMRYVAASYRFKADYRLGDQELVGRSHYEVFPEIPEHWKRVHQRCLAGATERAQEELFLRADGTREWVNWEIRPWYTSPGYIGGILMFTEVMTEHRQLHADLELRDQLIQLSYAPVFVWDLERGIQHWNRGAEKLYGFTKAEALGHSPHDFLHTQPPSPLPEVLPQLQATRHWAGELWRQTKEGHLVIVESRQELHEVEGRQWVLETNRDITEQKRMEQQLVFQASVLENLSEAVIASDEEQRVLTWNHAAQEIFGYAAAEMLGQSAMEMLGIQRPPAERRALMQLLEANGSIEGETSISTKDGQLRQVELNLRVHTDTAGQKIGHIAIARDITDIKLAQKKLEAQALELTRANAELTRASQAKSEFLAMMSHELRTPLNAILTISEALQDGIYGPLNVRQANRLDTLHASGTHLLHIINGILDFTKLEAGQMALQNAPADLHQLSAEALQIIRPQATAKQIQVVTSFEGLMEPCALDVQRVRQVLINLLDNAVKFTPAGGTISLAVTSDPPADTLQFEIRDTGPGIPADQLRYIFQPFVQLDSRLSREYEGTGLGLALAYRLLELMGGSIGVESTLGQGSRFFFRLPRQPLRTQIDGELGPLRSVTYPAKEDKMTETTQKPIVLIAEDYPDNLESLQDMLLARGYPVVTAANGAEALQRAAEAEPDIILMDIQMPVLDGLEAIRRLRTDPRFAQTHIVALTALVMPGDRERCLEAGANDYMEKPISLKKLVERLEGLSRKA